MIENYNSVSEEYYISSVLQDDKVTIIDDYYLNNSDIVTHKVEFSNKNDRLEGVKNCINVSLHGYNHLVSKIRSNSRLNWMEQYLSKGIKTYIEVKEIINNDPTYNEIKPVVENALTVLNIISLSATIGTMNPVSIILGLYNLSNTH